MEAVPVVNTGHLLTHRVNRAAGSAVAGLRAVIDAPVLLAGLDDLAMMGETVERHRRAQGREILSRPPDRTRLGTLAGVDPIRTGIAHARREADRHRANPQRDDAAGLVSTLVERGVSPAPDDAFKPLPRNDNLASRTETCLLVRNPG